MFRAPALDDVRGAALVTLPFLVVIGVARALHPPSATQVEHADPLVAWFNGIGGVWCIVLVGAVVAGAWLRIKPSRAALRRASAMTAAGVVAAIVIAIAIRLIAGPHLPAFIPPEESARPGLAQGLAAGVFEEVVFRLGLLPLLFYGLARRVSVVRASLIAIAITAFAFALSHELGPGAGAFHADRFGTRVLVPGAMMSMAFFVPGPAFIVAAHSTAHLLIPVLFY